MSASYEFYLTDDAGRRIAHLDRYAFASYTRATQGLAVLQFGVPFDYYKTLVPDIFRPDWRIDVWRSPEDGFPMRREGSFLLRKFTIYQRKEDGVRVIGLLGKSPLDLLQRGCVAVVTLPILRHYFEKTGAADDLMKQIISEAITDYAGFVVPSGEFTVDAPVSLGPTVTLSFQGWRLLDVFKKIKKLSFIANKQNPTNRKIYFDVEEYNTLSNGGFGYIFRTYADLRGQDRRNGGLIFSPENGNVGNPSYYEDYQDGVTRASIAYSTPGGAIVYDFPEQSLSRWNTIFSFHYGVETVAEGQNLAYVDYYDNPSPKVFNFDFLNTPGGANQPRSLYGVDWDLGDLVRAEFADKSFDVEIKIVYVAVDDKGKENVLGGSEVGS